MSRLVKINPSIYSARQKARGKRQKAKGKRQEAKGEAVPQLFAFTNVLTFLSSAIKSNFLIFSNQRQSSLLS
jgi:hypothetical protein